MCNPLSKSTLNFASLFCFLVKQLRAAFEIFHPASFFPPCAVIKFWKNFHPKGFLKSFFALKTFRIPYNIDHAQGNLGCLNFVVCKANTLNASHATPLQIKEVYDFCWINSIEILKKQNKKRKIWGYILKFRELGPKSWKNPSFKFSCRTKSTAALETTFGLLLLLSVFSNKMSIDLRVYVTSSIFLYICYFSSIKIAQH